MRYANRIRELRWVRAGDLAPHPSNWRRHPPEQRAALERVLSAVGWAGALLARETPGGLELVDGHLRREVGPDELVPVLVTNLTEEEGRTMLLATDPLAAMAEADAGLLEALMADVDPEVLAGVEPTLSKMLLKAEGFEPRVRVAAAAPDEFRCPSCGHEWSGSPKPAAA